MRTLGILSAAALGLGLAGPALASVVVVDYTLGAGGHSTGTLNGLAARATYTLNGAHLTILVENTSSGVPDDFDFADSLVVSLGLNLPVDILSGNSAVIGLGDVGVGSWSDRGPGDSVAEEWLWTNEYGGDHMQAWRQVISTSQGQGGGAEYGFGGHSFNVDGPTGGMVAAPPLLGVPASRPAVSNGILFDLTLAAPISSTELATAAFGGIIEYGSDARYLITPEPASALLLALAPLAVLRRRHR